MPKRSRNLNNLCNQMSELLGDKKRIEELKKHGFTNNLLKLIEESEKPGKCSSLNGKTKRPSAKRSRHGMKNLTEEFKHLLKLK